MIAASRAMRVLIATYAGPVRFTAAIERRTMQFRGCRIEVHAADGRLVPDGVW